MWFHGMGLKLEGLPERTIIEVEGAWCSKQGRSHRENDQGNSQSLKGRTKRED